MSKLIRSYVKGMKSDGGGWITPQQGWTMMAGFLVAMIIIWIKYV